MNAWGIIKIQDEGSSIDQRKVLNLAVQRPWRQRKWGKKCWKIRLCGRLRKLKTKEYSFKLKNRKLKTDVYSFKLKTQKTWYTNLLSLNEKRTWYVKWEGKKLTITELFTVVYVLSSRILLMGSRIHLRTSLPHSQFRIS